MKVYNSKIYYILVIIFAFSIIVYYKILNIVPCAI